MRARLLLLCTALGAFGFFIGSKPTDLPQSHFPPSTTALKTEALPSEETDRPASAPTSEPQSGLTAPPTDTESFKQLDLFLKQGTTSPADHRLRLMSAINALSPKQLERMLDQELKSDLFLRSDRFDFQYAAARFGEIAPQKAAELWASRGEARSFSTDLIAPWAKRDPVAFTNWTLTQPPEIQRAAREKLTQVASQDPALFASIAHQLASSPNASETARAAINALVGKEPSPENQIAYAQRLPEGAMRNAALSELATKTTFDIKSRPEVLQALANLPERDAHKIASHLAQKVDSLPPSPVREAAMQAALREQARTDPASAAKRLESLPANSADYAAAVRGFIDSTSAKDPASAAEWALSIPMSSATHRTGALERVATEYFRTNPDGAREWVEKAPLTDDEYRRLTGRTRTGPR